MPERRRLMIRYLRDLEALAPAGYTAGIHIRFASPMFMRSTYPEAWKAEYAAQSYSLRDPLVFWGISKSGQVRWSEINLPDPFGLMAKAAAHGLTFGAVCSCGTITSRTILGVSRSDREFTDAEIADVAAIADALHAVTPPPDDLTTQMVEALRIASQGTPLAAMAAEIGISESAFKSRLSSAQDLLGAKTMAEALRMAREYRLI